MARYAFGLRTGAGSTALPLLSLYGIANQRGAIREIGVSNTTAVAFAVAVRRFTTAGTAPTDTETEYDPELPPPLLAAFGTHTAGPTIAAGNIRVAAIGAAIGAGVIWTFGGTGLIVQAGTTNGVGVVVLTGTGQAADCYIDWEE